MGRPKIEIDKNTFETLAKRWATQEEIAAALGVSVDTLGRWCKRTYKDGKRGLTFQEVAGTLRLCGNVSIRERLFERMKKSDDVLLFMAKNYLGMTDKPAPPPPETNTNLFEQLNQMPEVPTDAIPEIQ